MRCDTVGMHVAVVGYGQIARSHTRILAAARAPPGLADRAGPGARAAFAQEHGYARHSTRLEDALESEPCRR